MPKHGSIILYVHGNQDGHLDSHTAPELWFKTLRNPTLNIHVQNTTSGECETACFVKVQNNDRKKIYKRCLKVEVAVPGSPSLISLMVSVDVKHHVYLLRETIQSSGAV